MIRPRRPAALVPLLAFLALALLAASAAAQEPVEEARRLRDAGETERAVEILRDRLARVPGDVDARWLLAQTLHWAGRVEAARVEYARALDARPGDAGLRFDYARFLVETGHARDAGEVLAPLAERAPPGWAPAVERLRRSILGASAPWASLEPALRDDSQPLTRAALGVEAGFWPAAGLSLAVRIAPQRYEGEIAAVGEETELTATEAVAAVAYDRAGSPLAFEVSGGVFVRDRPETTDAIGGASVTLRLPRGIALRGAALREPYLWTVSSLGRGVMADALELALDRSGAPGWAFAAGLRRETYDLGEGAAGAPRPTAGDDNAVTSAWAWALAPLWVRARLSLRAGGAFQWRDSEETRFDPAGFYDPYYTPEEVRVHSAVVAIAYRPRPAVTLRADGAVGVVAEERAPQALPVTPAPPAPGPGSTVVFVDRDFTPWRARVGATIGLGATGELRVEAERGEDAFFESTRVEAALTWWFAR